MGSESNNILFPPQQQTNGLFRPSRETFPLDVLPLGLWWMEPVSWCLGGWSNTASTATISTSCRPPGIEYACSIFANDDIQCILCLLSLLDGNGKS